VNKIVLLDSDKRRSRLSVIVSILKLCSIEQKKMMIQGRLIGNTKNFKEYIKICVEKGLLEEIKFKPFKGFEKWHKSKSTHDMSESRASKDGYHYRYKTTEKGFKLIQMIYTLESFLNNSYKLES
jgi:predicted transcriptional regulator